MSTSSDFLATMAAASHARSKAAQEQVSEAELQRRAHASPRPPKLLLSDQGFDLIAEVKLRSPAAGALSTASRGGPTDDIGTRAAEYARAGAAAVSVLTEPSRFDGTLAHLALAVQALGGRVPAMRKDFIVDPYQVMEARVAGAGGVLLILRMLSRGQIDMLLSCSVQLGLFVLLEAFDEQDLEIAAQLTETAPSIGNGNGNAPLLVGVNCRDLVTLKVVPGRLEQLARNLPLGVPRVAESGVATPEDAARVRAAGYDMALVGSALMLADDAGALVTAMLAAARKG